MKLAQIMNGGSVVFAPGCNSWGDVNPEDVRAFLAAQASVARTSAEDFGTRAYFEMLPPADISAVSPADRAAQSATAKAFAERSGHLAEIAETLEALAVLLCGPDSSTGKELEDDAS